MRERERLCVFIFTILDNKSLWEVHNVSTEKNVAGSLYNRMNHSKDEHKQGKHCKQGGGPGEGGYGGFFSRAGMVIYLT